MSTILGSIWDIIWHVSSELSVVAQDGEGRVGPLGRGHTRGCVVAGGENNVGGLDKGRKKCGNILLGKKFDFFKKLGGAIDESVA